MLRIRIRIIMKGRIRIRIEVKAGFRSASESPGALEAHYGAIEANKWSTRVVEAHNGAE
jgi:hypothetical protein